MLILQTPIEKRTKINSKYRKGLEKLNIRTIGDLLFHFPFRYDDYSRFLTITRLKVGETATIEGMVTASRQIKSWKKRIRITEIFIKDNSGYIRAIWFNQPFIANLLPKGKTARLSGKISSDKNGLFFSNPAWENTTRQPTNTAGLIPVYNEAEGITSKWLRWQIQESLRLIEKIPDPIPVEILKELHLPSLELALQYIHFPQNHKQYALAQKRFAFEEMLILQISSLQIKNTWKKESAAKITICHDFIKKFITTLPFELTGAQQKAYRQILQDISKPQPMNRLLNGDVGSGKTLVAALATLVTAQAGLQTSIMAPTEVLARQHFESINKLFSSFKISIALLTNSYQIINLNSKTSNLKKIPNDKISKINRNELLENIKNGQIDLVIGTHSLIQKNVHFKNLALIIVDEQHRFGVAQRAYLQQEITQINDGLPGKIPHLLSMTATPIPRTLSLTFFGNLDISILDEMPKNRIPIKTKIISEKQRADAYDFVRSQIKNGRQAFIIFPLIEESESLSELKAATTEHQRLSQEIFPDISLGLLHGKLKSAEKEKVMDDFKNKKYDILVATSVVEVGIDIPNATVIIIEDAERFGLSQLHQFRGRVGRGQHPSYCLLFTSNFSAKAKARLGALEKNNNGFDIAEKDLEIRGPGQFFGTQQSGLPDITMQNITNIRLIEVSKKYATLLLADDPELKKNPLLAKKISNLNRNTHLE